MDYSNEDLRNVAAMLGIKMREEPAPPKKEKFNSSERKILKGTVVCKLCGTQLEQFFKLKRHDKETWIKEEDLCRDSAEVCSCTTIVSFSTTVRCCIACRDVLGEMSKEYLIDLLLNMASPVPNRKAILKYLAEIHARHTEEGEENDTSNN